MRPNEANPEPRPLGYLKILHFVFHLLVETRLLSFSLLSPVVQMWMLGSPISSCEGMSPSTNCTLYLWIVFRTVALQIWTKLHPILSRHFIISWLLVLISSPLRLSSPVSCFHRHGAGALSGTSSARFDQNSAGAKNPARPWWKSSTRQCVESWT